MCKLHPAVAACVKLCCHDDTPARLAQGRSGGDDELDVPGDATGFAQKLVLKDQAVPTVLEPARTPQTHLTKQCSGSVRSDRSLTQHPVRHHQQWRESTADPRTAHLLHLLSRSSLLQYGAVLSGHAASIAEKESGDQ
ncbi:hypothetical protein DPX16_11237 [Anabarilius grahami]|uniref:Uncharacterized protein n=1 Tax=Anabarilius grahami TaxID=495550 RepID=A0A3N0Y2J9_ANAGA|nr:hypothetical protein DPX16_11237 [Anabarilius grahami]